MISAITRMGILTQGKFVDMKTDMSKSSLVFRLNVAGSGKQIVLNHKLKWGRNRLSTRSVAAIGAVGIVGAASLGYLVKRGVIHDVNDVLFKYIEHYNKLYKNKITDDNVNIYFEKMNKCWNEVKDSYGNSMEKAKISNDVDERTKVLRSNLFSKSNIKLVAETAVLLKLLGDHKKKTLNESNLKTIKEMLLRTYGDHIDRLHTFFDTNVSMNGNVGGAGTQEWMGNRSTFSFQEELIEYLKLSEKKYKFPKDAVQRALYLRRANRYYKMLSTNLSAIILQFQHLNQQTEKYAKSLSKFLTVSNVMYSARVAVLLKSIDPKMMQPGEANTYSELKENFYNLFDDMSPVYGEYLNGSLFNKIHMKKDEVINRETKVDTKETEENKSNINRQKPYGREIIKKCSTDETNPGGPLSMTASSKTGFKVNESRTLKLDIISPVANDTSASTTTQQESGAAASAPTAKPKQEMDATISIKDVRTIQVANLFRSKMAWCTYRDKKNKMVRTDSKLTFFTCEKKDDKLAEFSRAAMEVEEEMLYDDLDQVEVESTKVCKGDIAENAISADAKSEEEKDLSGKSLSQGAPAETVVLITRNKDAMVKAVEVKPENPVSKNTSAALSSKKNAQPAASVNEKSASSPAVRNAASSDEINHKGKTFSPGDTNKFKWSRKDEQTTTSRETSNASGSSFNGSRGNQKNDENPTSSTARAKFTPPQKFQEQQQQEVEQGKDTSAVRYSWRRGSTADGRGRDGNDQQPQQLQPQSQQQSRITPTNNQAKWDAPSTHNQRKWDGRDDGSRSANHRGGAVDTSKGRDVKSLSPTLNSTKHLSSGNGNDVGGGGPPNGGGVVGGQGRGGWEPPPRGGSGREGSHGRGAGRGRGYHDRNNEKSNTGRDRR